MQSNLDRWRLFMRDIESPDSYIDWGFYHLISSALQRRVWMYSDAVEHLPCSFSLFPNIYVLLVGPPSTGKGRVVVQENSIIKAQELDKPGPDGKLKSEIPCAPDKITLEKLIRHIAQNLKTVSRTHPTTGKKQSYAYCPCSLVIEELEVLFSQNTNDMVNVINKCYDAQDLKYETKHQGEDNIRNVCISMIAGTTPDSIKDLMLNKILKKGMTSRCFFIYEDKPRFFRQFPGLDPSQQQARKELIQHIKALTQLFTEVKMTPEAAAYDKEFYESGAMSNDRLNKDAKLDDYYGRKRMHWLKMAMIILYSNQIESNLITLDILQHAYNVLRSAEVRMHEAFHTTGRNVLYETCLDIERHLENKGVTPYKRLWWAFSKDVNKQQFEEVITLLVQTHRIREENGYLHLNPNRDQKLKCKDDLTIITSTEPNNEQQQDSLCIDNGSQPGTPNGEPVDIRHPESGVPQLPSEGVGQS